MTKSDAQTVLEALQQSHEHFAHPLAITPAKLDCLERITREALTAAQRLVEGEKCLNIAFRFIQAVAMSPNGTEFKYTAQDALKEITDMTAGCWKQNPPTTREE